MDWIDRIIMLMEALEGLCTGEITRMRELMGEILDPEELRQIDIRIGIIATSRRGAGVRPVARLD